MKIEARTLSGDAAGEMELDDSIFGLTPRLDVMQRVALWQLAKRRSGTRRSQTRSMVARTGKKAWRQKGTGNARHGDRKSNIFRGGAKAHGPVVRSHETALPKKVRLLGLKHALSQRAREEGGVIGLEAAQLDAVKTKDLRARLATLGIENALVVDGNEIQREFMLSARNIPTIQTIPARGLNVRDILRRKALVLTRAGLEAIEARLG